jgi:hypothetical protein
MHILEEKSMENGQLVNYLRGLINSVKACHLNRSNTYIIDRTYN